MVRSYGRTSNSGIFASLFDLLREGPAMTSGASVARADPSAEKDKWGLGIFVIEISGMGLVVS